jgi:NADH:ubiquinone oxidoreductase subunit 5 (subunit L)/multisubunit Na+/H+ antiporter MnhA subunit
MHGLTGTVIGLIVTAIGLAGLGIALAQMMTHANPQGALFSVGGLGVFLVACFAVVALLR